MEQQGVDRGVRVNPVLDMVLIRSSQQIIVGFGFGLKIHYTLLLYRPSEVLLVGWWSLIIQGLFLVFLMQVFSMSSSSTEWVAQLGTWP